MCLMFNNNKHLLPALTFIVWPAVRYTHTRRDVLQCALLKHTQSMCLCALYICSALAGSPADVTRYAERQQPLLVTQLVVKFLLFILRPLFAFPTAIVHVQPPLSNNPLWLQRESAPGRARGRVAQAKVARSSATPSAALLPLAGRELVEIQLSPIRYRGDLQLLVPPQQQRLAYFYGLCELVFIT